MAFSQKYPVSSYFYDPAIAPTKQMNNLQKTDSNGVMNMQTGRYDTTYRREFLNFDNGMEMGDQSNLNPFSILPPIGSARDQRGTINNYIEENKYANSIDHLIDKNPTSQNVNPSMPANNNNMPSPEYLPAVPINLNPQEEQALLNDLCKEFQHASSEQIKQFYKELALYDPKLSGFVHYQYINMAAMKVNLPINESLLRFVMSRFVSPNKERGYVNYDELVKFFDKCINIQGNVSNQAMYGNHQYENQHQQQGNFNQQQNMMNQQQTMPQGNISGFLKQPTYGPDGKLQYDPDEQAILRLMHENMREWDQVNLIDCDNLRRKFYEADRNNRYILSQSEIEDVCYRNRVPIQRSLTFQILEKYCKVATGQYRWPAFVDFLEKLHRLRLPNKKKTDYTIRTDEKDNYSEKFTYRIRQLDTLKSKASEEERIAEINKQISNLQNMKSETQQKIGHDLNNYIKGESWFTRFMRLASAIYTHRASNGAEFTLPKDEARSLIKAYNTVYELNISNEVIEDALNRCQKGNIIIDDLLKVLSKVNLTMS